MVSGTSISPKTFRQAIVVLGVIEIQNPNLVKPETIKARDIYIGKTSEFSWPESVEIEKQRAYECYMKLQEQGKAEQPRKYLGGGIPKGRVGGKSIKKLHRKNRSIWNLPYWKPFLMALRSRKKQQRVKGGTAACVKKAAKICHSSKAEDDLFLTKFMETFKASMLEAKKNYYNRTPTFIGYSDGYKRQVDDYYY